MLNGLSQLVERLLRNQVAHHTGIASGIAQSPFGLDSYNPLPTTADQEQVYVKGSLDYRVPDFWTHVPGDIPESGFVNRLVYVYRHASSHCLLDTDAYKRDGTVQFKGLGMATGSSSDAFTPVGVKFVLAPGIPVYSVQTALRAVLHDAMKSKVPMDLDQVLGTLAFGKTGRITKTRVPLAVEINTGNQHDLAVLLDAGGTAVEGVLANATVYGSVWKNGDSTIELNDTMLNGITDNQHTIGRAILDKVVPLPSLDATAVAKLINASGDTNGGVIGSPDLVIHW